MAAQRQPETRPKFRTHSGQKTTRKSWRNVVNSTVSVVPLRLNRISRETTQWNAGESVISSNPEASSLVPNPNLLEQEVRILAYQNIDTSVTAIGALEMDSALPSRNAKISDSQNYPLALTLGRTESIYNATALGVDWMEQANRLAVLVAEQMVPYVRAVALAAEQMVPYVRAAALVAEQMAPYVRAVALVAEQIIPYVRAVARVASQLEPARISLAMVTTVQTRSTLSDRTVAKANAKSESERELPVTEYEVLEAPLVLASESGARRIDSKDRSAVLEQGLRLESRASLGHGIEALEYQLANIDPDLLNLLWGARAALETPNPDRARQVMVSLRELVTHVLHLLAPDASIQNWNNDPNCYHNGRPTRKTRLLYINRKISSASLSKSVDAHVAWTLELIKVLNAETHVISSCLTDQELHTIVIATESLLYSLLWTFPVGQTRSKKMM